MSNLQEKINIQYEYMDKVALMSMEFREKNSHFPKVYIESYGCQMNERDTETLKGFLYNMNYEITEKFEEADLAIFNTCSVREHAEDKLYGKIGTLKTIKATKKPNLKIAICGCMVQKKGAAAELVKRFKYIDIVFGTHNLYTLPQLLMRSLNGEKNVVDVWDVDGEVVENLPVSREDGLKAWVNIAYGCNNFCTYCIVPYVRGRERSRKSEDIINEVKDLASKGYKEVTLLGQNVNSYGKGLNDECSFPELLRRLDLVEGIERIRFMTPHPKDLSNELIDVVINSKKICENIHLPLQAGSTKVLKTMNRHYTKEQYITLAKDIRERVPDVSITTDIIVGFPGETEEEFLDTLDVVREVEFDLAYTFIYSKRPGTPAAKMEEQISDDVKHDRLNRLIALQNEMCLKRNKILEGTVVEVLVDGVSKSNESHLMGRTRSNKIVNFEGDKSLIGKLVKVKINEGEKFWLRGEIFK